MISQKSQKPIYCENASYNCVLQTTCVGNFLGIFYPPPHLVYAFIDMML